jgi:hypothetical protein
MTTAALLIWLAGHLSGSALSQALRCDTPQVLASPVLFVDCARAGTEKYRDRSNAIADGYRLVGGDFPAMGEHWIRISSLFDGRFDASRPEVLNYVTIGGKPQLFGVGYAVPLLEGEVPPEGPAGQSAWHDHTRTIADETTLPHHHAAGHVAAGPRLAMMHAWIWSANPQGTFAADNWGLPYLRIGLKSTLDAPAEAAKALSLASGGTHYFAASIAAVTGNDEPAGIKAAFERAERSVLAILRENDGPALSDARINLIAQAWHDLWVEIDESLSAAQRERLAHLPIR